MIRILKALGLALAALVVVSGAAASAAQASSELHIGTQPAVITAGTPKTAELTVTNTKGTKFTGGCNKASVEGTTEGQTISDSTVTAAFSECTLFGLSATVKLNGCKFTVTGTAALTLKADIVGCTSGKKIEVKSLTCTLTIGEQNELSHLTVENKEEGGKKELFETATVSGITFTQDGAQCPDGNGHTSANASFTAASATLAAYKDAGTKQVTNNEHQYSEHICGEQVNITAT